MKAFYCRFVKTETGTRSFGKQNYAFFELYRFVEQGRIPGHVFDRNTVSFRPGDAQAVLGKDMRRNRNFITGRERSNPSHLAKPTDALQIGFSRGTSTSVVLNRVIFIEFSGSSVAYTDNSVNQSPPGYFYRHFVPEFTF